MSAIVYRLGRTGKKSDAATTSQSHVESNNLSNVDHFIINTSSDELYYCEDCGNHFDSIESYDKTHSGPNGCPGAADFGSQVTVHAVEVKDETYFDEETIDDDSVVIEDELIEELADVSEPQLWEVVDDDAAETEFILEEEANPDHEAEAEAEVEPEAEESPNKSERYFCFDCHSIFETRQSAEEHSCPEGEANPKKNNPKFAKTQTPIRRKLPVSIAAGSSNNTSTVCSICKTKFSSAKCLKFHMRIHNKRSPKSIQDALPVGAHQQYSELDQFYCEICNKSFEQNLLTVHKQMHQSQNQFSCGICNRKFDTVTNYEMHLKIHDRQQVNNSSNNSSNSNKTAGGKDKPGFACQYCERVFQRPYEKVKHERIHTGEKPYSCEVCGKTFRVSYSLTLHLRTHTNIRPYVCTTCNKRFKSHTVYAHHLRIHSTERQYVCDSCPKSFRTSVQLYAHKNTHTKPYQCAVCNRPFASMYAVKSHMATHRTGDAKNITNEVIKNQHLSNKYWCVTCGAEYARPFALRLHMKSAHGHPDDADTRLAKVSATDNDEAIVPDTETAVLIAAAKADSAYLNSADNDLDVSDPKYEECIVISADGFDVETYHNEEIITDWLK
ncbi:zinc finger protein 260 isoform X2 [Drosophila innubila]|uniref:zinc finger protein 260 isoform X2 n=1 Tax=Drosophila innubila TaxID=198719 RepID=UPI00148D7F05|nr:zinc finger protein 260 isoform X2 [Drosophila innubila]